MLPPDYTTPAILLSCASIFLMAIIRRLQEWHQVQLWIADYGEMAAEVISPPS